MPILSRITLGNQLQTDKSILSFTAPYIRGDALNTLLGFELTITDKDGKTGNPPYKVNVIVKRVQRAIIFQGGVALGAYEAGVYQAIVDKLLKNDQDRKKNGLDRGERPLFDIVAGTSIGVMNGAIVVRSVTDGGKDLDDPKNWEDSAGQVTKFWRTQQQFPTVADFLEMAFWMLSTMRAKYPSIILMS